MIVSKKLPYSGEVFVVIFLISKSNSHMHCSPLFKLLHARQTVSAQLSDTVCAGQVADANADAQTVAYSTGAFDSTITTPVHNNKPAVQLDDESAVLPDEPKISFEATSSRDSEEVAIKIKDDAFNSGNLRATLSLKESSAEQLMFSKRVNEESDGYAGAVGLGDDSDNDNVAADTCTEESWKVNAPARSPEEAGGGMMQSVDI